jgi:DNA-binding MarR family transcriptional regulator
MPSRTRVDADAVSRLRGVIIRLARQFNTSASDEGLSPTQASVLGIVVFRGPISLSELAQLEGLNPTMLSRVVSKLVGDGLIRRQADQTDQRAVHVEGTKAGAALHQRIKDRRTAIISACLEQLPARHSQDLLAALDALEALATELMRAPR